MKRVAMSAAACLGALVMGGAAVMTSSVAQPEYLAPVPESPDEASKGALKAGDEVPEGVFFLDSASEKVELSSLLEDGPVALIFFRGSWCPYCVGQLKEFEDARSQIESAGGRVIAVTPELPTFIDKPADKWGIGFPVYSDVDLRAGRAFRVAYTTSSYGRQLRRSNGNDRGELPLGAAFVINGDSEVTWAYTESNFKKRAKPSDVIEAVTAAAG